jgi:hypothetical protein
MLSLKYVRLFLQVLARQIVQYVKDKVKLIVLTVVGPVLSVFNSNASLIAVFVQQSVPRLNRSIWAQKVNNDRKASWSSASGRTGRGRVIKVHQGFPWVTGGGKLAFFSMQITRSQFSKSRPEEIASCSAWWP